jgi:hypothetical protein
MTASAVIGALQLGQFRRAWLRPLDLTALPSVGSSLTFILPTC